MKKILAGHEVVSMAEAGIHDDIVEDGVTFEENALKKATFIFNRLKSWIIADDSGLCIEALDNAPGVYSARWAGENSSDQAKVDKTLMEMKDVPEGKRGAFFESAAVLLSPDGKEYVFSDRVYGKIALAPHGTPLSKLPYDSIFIPEGCEQTFAEMPAEVKNAMSHRGLAFKKLKEFLDTIEIPL